MATFFRSSKVWVIDFQYDGRPRRWLKAWPDAVDARAHAEALLQELYGGRAQLVGVRPASEQEDSDYRQGRQPRHAYCPSGREPTSEPSPPEGLGRPPDSRQRAG